MADEVWLKWLDGGVVIRSAFASVADAKSQAAADGRNYLGVFDGPDDQAAKIAEAKGGDD